MGGGASRLREPTVSPAEDAGSQPIEPDAATLLPTATRPGASRDMEASSAGQPDSQTGDQQEAPRTQKAPACSQKNSHSPTVLAQEEAQRLQGQLVDRLTEEQSKEKAEKNSPVYCHDKFFNRKL